MGERANPAPTVSQAIYPRFGILCTSKCKTVKYAPVLKRTAGIGRARLGFPHFAVKFRYWAKAYCHRTVVDDRDITPGYCLNGTSPLLPLLPCSRLPCQLPGAPACVQVSAVNHLWQSSRLSRRRAQLLSYLAPRSARSIVVSHGGCANGD